MVSSAPRHHYTLDDYLSVEEISRVKHEFLDGEIFAMAGGTPEHAALAAAIIGILSKALPAGCRSYSSDLRVSVPTSGLMTYPDAAIICGEPTRDSKSPTHVTNPLVIIEVLSPSTEEYDRGEKREHYQRLESLREYVLVAQDRRRVEVFARNDSAGWNHAISESGATVGLSSLRYSFGVDELYDAAGVT